MVSGPIMTVLTDLPLKLGDTGEDMSCDMYKLSMTVLFTESLGFHL